MPGMMEAIRAQDRVPEFVDPKKKPNKSRFMGTMCDDDQLEHAELLLAQGHSQRRASELSGVSQSVVCRLAKGMYD